MASDTYYPHVGGIAEHVHHLSLELRKRGHHVDILTSNHARNTFNFEDPPYVIRVGRGIKIPINKSMAPIAFSPFINLKVRNIVRGGNYDIIHTHGSLAPTLPILALNYSRSVNFATFHAAHSESLGYELFKPYLHKLFRKIDGPIAVSEVARDTMMRHFSGNYRIIPNGVDINRFNPEVPPFPDLRGDGFFNLLFVGRFDPRKGLRFLLKALPRIVKEVRNTRLIVVGSGPLKKYYQQFIKSEIRDRVLFTGPVSPEELPRYYATCDMLVSPATGAESFGIILLEAMASGKPVVASDIPGYRQVMENGREGLFVRPEDPEALARAVIELLRHPEAMKGMGEAGREKAVSFYSWDRIAGEVESYYFEVLERNRRP